MLVATADRADLALDSREIGPTSHYAQADVFQPAVTTSAADPAETLPGAARAGFLAGYRGLVRQA